MSFDAAVRALVQIHDTQINQLQQQLANQQLAKSYSLKASLLDEDLEPVPPDLHEHLPYQFTPMTPRLLSSPRERQCSPRQMVSTPRQLQHASNGNLCHTPRGYQLFHIQSQTAPCSVVHPEPNTAERINDTVQPNGCDGPCLDVCLELDKQLSIGSIENDHSIHLWATLVQNVLHWRDSGCVIREGWVQPSSSKARLPSDLLFRLDTIMNTQRAQSQLGVGGLNSLRTHLNPLPRFQQGSRPAFVVHPESLARRCWLLLSMLVIIYEVIAITMAPFQLFDGEKSPILETATAIFWVVDIILTFFTGVYINGKLEVRLLVIGKRYVCTWFAFDLVVASMHVAATFAEPGEFTKSGTLLKIIRVVRAMRLGRMLSWITEAFTKVLSKRASMFGGKVTQCLIGLYLFVHLNACLWYEIGKGSDGWVSGYVKLGNSAGEKYLVAMHWSLSQLQGNSDIYPGRAPIDRVYVVVSSFASIIFLALLVSTLTDALFTAHEERKVMRTQARLVEGFFNRHHVKPALRRRAEYHLRLRQNAEHSMGYEDQDRQALEMFPFQLRWRLLAESRTSILAWHPVFSYLHDFHMSLYANVCTEVLVWHAYEPEDDTFMSSTRSIGAYYIFSGEFVFNARLNLLDIINPWLDDFIETRTVETRSFMRQISESSDHPAISKQQSARSSGSMLSDDKPTYQDMLSNKSPKCVTRLHPGQLVTEISLWSPWAHSGDMSAVIHGQCFSLLWSELLTLIAQYSEPHRLFSSYAVRFVNAANMLRGKKKTDQAIELMGFADLLDVEIEHANQVPKA